jgi:hypothetical protein
MAITAKSPDDGAARASTAQEIAEADTATTARLVAYRQEIGLGAVRSTVTASRSALGALMRRDLVVLRKDVVIFCLRTVIQPFLLVFVFLYVFPTIGQGIGSSGHGHVRGCRRVRRPFGRFARIRTRSTNNESRFRPVCRRLFGRDRSDFRCR